MCYYHQHACLFVCLSLLPVCLSVSQTSMDNSGHKGNTGQLKSFGYALSNNLNYESSLSLSISKLSQNHWTHVLIEPSVIA